MTKNSPDNQANGNNLEESGFIPALQSYVRHDQRSMQVWIFLSFAAATFSIVAFFALNGSAFSAFMAGVFTLGGTVLFLKSRRSLRDFEHLMANGQQSYVDIEIVDAGGGDTLSVRIYEDKSSFQPSITFQSAPDLLSRGLELRRRHPAVLIRREESCGTVAVSVDGVFLIPNSRVRYARA